MRPRSIVFSMIWLVLLGVACQASKQSSPRPTLSSVPGFTPSATQAVTPSPREATLTEMAAYNARLEVVNTRLAQTAEANQTAGAPAMWQTVTALAYQVTTRPTITLTPTPSPTPLLPTFNQVPPLPLYGTLRLRLPEVDLLIQAIHLASDEWDFSNRMDWDSIGMDVVSSDSSALADMVAFLLDHFYPGEIPGASRLFTSGGSAWVSPHSPTGLYRLIREGFVQYMNDTSQKLDDKMPTVSGEDNLNFKWTSHPLDIDGDSQVEWLVELDVYGQRVYIPLDRGKDGFYYQIPNDLPNINENFMRGIDLNVEHDLNGDRRPDVVLTQYSYIGGGANSGFIDVYAWDGKGLYRLDSFSLDSSADIQITWKIADVNGDGREELQVQTPRCNNALCCWDQVDVYRWNGRSPVYSHQGLEPPSTPLCDASRALKVWTNLTPAQKAAYLSSALQHLPDDQNIPGDLLALFHVHLAMNYAMQGLDQQAWSQLKQGSQVPGGGVYTALVRKNLQASNGSLIAFCNGMYAAAYNTAQPLQSDIDQYLTLDSGLIAYPYQNRPYEPLVCPLQDLVSARLERLQLPSAVDPLPAFMKAGLPLENSLYLDIDKDGIPEWLGALALSEPRLLLLDPKGGEWCIQDLTYLGGPVSKLEALVKDVNGDGQPDLLILATLSEPVPAGADSPCHDDGSTTQILILEAIPDGYRTIWRNAICGRHPPIEQVFSDEAVAAMLADQQQIADHRPGSGLSYPSLQELLLGSAVKGTLAEYIDTLSNDTIANKTPGEIRARIRGLLNRLPAGEILTPFIAARLVFLEGLSYQLEGQEESAVQTYQNLLSAYPQSAWSWMATSMLDVSLPPTPTSTPFTLAGTP